MPQEGLLKAALRLIAKQFLVLVTALNLALLAFQLALEEREFGERFGVPYLRYCELVPRFVPRRRPVRRRDLHT
jgi:protein-S-isoprenylcysteine O-methyltransferase Ste14